MCSLTEFPIGEAWEQRETVSRPVPPADLVALPDIADRRQLAHQIGDLRDGLLQGPQASVRPEPDVVGVGLRIRNALWAALYGVRGGLRARAERQR